MCAGFAGRMQAVDEARSWQATWYAFMHMYVCMHTYRCLCVHAFSKFIHRSFLMLSGKFSSKECERRRQYPGMSAAIASKYVSFCFLNTHSMYANSCTGIQILLKSLFSRNDPLLLLSHSPSLSRFSMQPSYLRTAATTTLTCLGHQCFHAQCTMRAMVRMFSRTIGWRSQY